MNERTGVRRGASGLGRLLGLVAIALVSLVPAAAPQSAVAVPHLIRISGKLQDAPPHAGTVGVTFSIYAAQTGGTPLWSEMQNVAVDEPGHYTAFLGNGSAAGVPSEVFQTTEERWLGVRAEGQAEGTRLLLVSVPYALHAEEAERLAGRLPSEFVSAEQLRAEVQREVQQRSGPSATSAGNQPMAVGVVSPSSAGGVNAGPTNFTGTTSDEIVLVQQSGTGYALHAVGAGTVATVFAESNGTAPAVQGASNVASGTVIGIYGTSQSPNGTAVRGDANATSGSGIGVWGVSRGPSGRAVLGQSVSATGATFGVQGQVFSPSGIGVHGLATSTTGFNFGVLGESRSAGGVAGVFNNSAGGKILSGQNNWTEKFRVSGNGDMFTAGSLSATGNVTATSFFGNGSNLTGLVKSLTQGSGILLTGGSSMPTVGIDPAFVPTLNANVFTGTQTAPTFAAGTALTASANPAVNGQFVVMPQSADSVSVLSTTGWAPGADQTHLRLSRSTTDPSGGKDFLITPYEFGTAVEYAGVIEVWSKAFSVHGYGANSPNFWVDDEGDLGGLLVQGRVDPLPNGHVRIAAQRFDGSSHGTIIFTVRNPEDVFNFTSGGITNIPEHLLVSIGQVLSPAVQASALQVRSPSVLTALESDELAGRGLVGTRTNNMLDFIIGDQTASPAMRLFTTGNLAIGSTVDGGARLRVGSGGGFQVADSGAVTIGASGTPITQHASATGSLNFGSLAVGACSVATITVTGAADGDTVALGVPQTMAGASGLMFFGWVSAADTVSVRACNVSGGTVGLLTGTVRADVWKH
jgi:hypothetical protein